MEPLVSVLVPVYGVEKYIEKCVRSLFEQTYDNIEYVFVDDKTNDNSISILKNVLKEYPKRKDNVKIVKHIQNKGLSGARNTAIDNSTGDYLMHVDSDDYLDLNVVESLVNTALFNNADIVVYDMKYVYDDRCFPVVQSVNTNPKEYIKQLLTYEVSVCVCGKFYKSSLYKDYDIRFIEGLNFGEDYVTSPRIAYYAKKIAYCDKCFYNYVQYNNSSYTNSYKAKNVTDLVRAVAILDDFFHNKEDYTIYGNDIALAHLYVKVRLLIGVCLNYQNIGELIPKLSELYKDKWKYNKYLPFFYRIILFLAKYHFYKLMRVYVNMGIEVKHFFLK